MFNIVFLLVVAGYTPYHIYRSLKREKLSQKLSGLTTAMVFVFLIIGTRSPLQLRHTCAFGLLAIGVATELLYLAYREKSSFGYLSAGILGVLGIYLLML